MMTASKMRQKKQKEHENKAEESFVECVVDATASNCSSVAHFRTEKQIAKAKVDFMGEDALNVQGKEVFKETAATKVCKDDSSTDLNNNAKESDLFDDLVCTSDSVVTAGTCVGIAGKKNSSTKSMGLPRETCATSAETPLVTAMQQKAHDISPTGAGVRKADITTALPGCSATPDKTTSDWVPVRSSVNPKGQEEKTPMVTLSGNIGDVALSPIPTILESHKADATGSGSNKIVVSGLNAVSRDKKADRLQRWRHRSAEKYVLPKQSREDSHNETTGKFSITMNASVPFTSSALSQQPHINDDIAIHHTKNAEVLLQVFDDKYPMEQSSTLAATEPFAPKASIETKGQLSKEDQTNLSPVMVSATKSGDAGTPKLSRQTSLSGTTLKTYLPRLSSSQENSTSVSSSLAPAFVRKNVPPGTIITSQPLTEGEELLATAQNFRADMPYAEPLKIGSSLPLQVIQQQSKISDVNKDGEKHLESKENRNAMGEDKVSIFQKSHDASVSRKGQVYSSSCTEQTSPPSSLIVNTSSSTSRPQSGTEVGSHNITNQIALSQMKINPHTPTTSTHKEGSHGIVQKVESSVPLIQDIDNGTVRKQGSLKTVHTVKQIIQQQAGKNEAEKIGELQPETNGEQGKGENQPTFAKDNGISTNKRELYGSLIPSKQPHVSKAPLGGDERSFFACHLGRTEVGSVPDADEATRSMQEKTDLSVPAGKIHDEIGTNNKREAFVSPIANVVDGLMQEEFIKRAGHVVHDATGTKQGEPNDIQFHSPPVSENSTIVPASASQRNDHAVSKSIWEGESCSNSGKKSSLEAPSRKQSFSDISTVDVPTDQPGSELMNSKGGGSGKVDQGIRRPQRLLSHSSSEIPHDNFIQNESTAISTQRARPVLSRKAKEGTTSSMAQNLPVSHTPCPLCGEFFHPVDIVVHASKCAETNLKQAKASLSSSLHASRKRKVTPAFSRLQNLTVLEDSTLRPVGEDSTPTDNVKTPVFHRLISEKGQQDRVKKKSEDKGQKKKDISTDGKPKRDIFNDSERRSTESGSSCSEKDRKSYVKKQEWADSGQDLSLQSRVQSRMMSSYSEAASSKTVLLINNTVMKEQALLEKRIEKLTPSANKKECEEDFEEKLTQDAMKADVAIQGVFPSFMGVLRGGRQGKRWLRGKDVPQVPGSILPVTTKPFASSHEAHRFLELLRRTTSEHYIQSNATTTTSTGGDNQSDTSNAVVIQFLSYIRQARGGKCSIFQLMLKVKSLIARVTMSKRQRRDAIDSDEGRTLRRAELMQAFECFLPPLYKMTNVIVNDANPNESKAGSPQSATSGKKESDKNLQGATVKATKNKIANVNSSAEEPFKRKRKAAQVGSFKERSPPQGSVRKKSKSVSDSIFPTAKTFSSRAALVDANITDTSHQVQPPSTDQHQANKNIAEISSLQKKSNPVLSSGPLQRTLRPPLSTTDEGERGYASDPAYENHVRDTEPRYLPPNELAVAAKAHSVAAASVRTIIQPTTSDKSFRNPPTLVHLSTQSYSPIARENLEVSVNECALEQGSQSKSGANDCISPVLIQPNTIQVDHINRGITLTPPATTKIDLKKIMDQSDTSVHVPSTSTYQDSNLSPRTQDFSLIQHQVMHNINMSDVSFNTTVKDSSSMPPSYSQNKLYDGSQKPIKACNPFTHFCRELKPNLLTEFKAEYSTKSEKEIRTIMHNKAISRWHSLPEAKEEVYKAMSEEDHKRFQEEMRIYTEVQNLKGTG